MLFEYIDYRKFIRKKIALTDVKGTQTHLAIAAKCQKSYFSQVINNKSHLTNEQAARLSKYWDLNQFEQEYFLNLVELNKTTDIDLIKVLESRMSQAKVQYFELKNRMKNITDVSEKILKEYYSSWEWSAIHIATSLPQLTNEIQISKFLSISYNKTKNIIDKLLEYKLVERSGDKLKFIGKNIHAELGSSSYLSHHLNWQRKTTEHIQSNRKDGKHFSSIQSHSKKDQPKIKKIILQAIENINTIVESSEENSLSFVSLNYFPLEGE